MVEHGVELNHLNEVDESPLYIKLRHTAFAYGKEYGQQVYKKGEIVLKYLIQSRAIIHKQEIEKIECSNEVKTYLAKLCSELKQEQWGKSLKILDKVCQGNAKDWYFNRLPIKVLGMIDKAMESHFIIDN